MMSDEVTIHAARVDREGNLWVQSNPGHPWHHYVLNSGFEVFDLDAGVGTTTPVRITTADPARDAVVEAAKVLALKVHLCDDCRINVNAAVDHLAGTGPQTAICPTCCPTCGPTALERHPRLPEILRCRNCKEHLVNTVEDDQPPAEQAASATPGPLCYAGHR